ncbi:MAG: (deoxy)nucleoside triphosphate pyrophosphohydrolase [Myxococcota bacterium]
MLRVVAAVIVRDGRLLAALRPAHKREGGKWELPGGKVEPGEADGDALAREIAEELGVVARVGAPLAVSIHGDVELVALRCEIAGEPVAREHDALRWLSRDELHEVDWAPADVPLVASLSAELGGLAEQP